VRLFASLSDKFECAFVDVATTGIVMRYSNATGVTIQAKVNGMHISMSYYVPRLLLGVCIPDGNAL